MPTDAVFGRSDEEVAMREMIVTRLRHSYPGARIIHELPLRYSSNRIDLAAITPDQLVAVEIKSSRDELRRLERQLRAFLPVSHQVVVALAPKWLKGKKPPARSIVRAIGGHVETWCVCARSSVVETVDGGHRTTLAPWSSQLLDMLWRAELEAIADQHEIAIARRRPSHAILRDVCEAALTGRQIRAAVCAALRARVAFGRASDPAIPVQIPDLAAA